MELDSKPDSSSMADDGQKPISQVPHRDLEGKDQESVNPAERTEYGRGYQNYRPDLYNLPSDKPEQGRLDVQHHLFGTTLHQKLHLAPLDHLRNEPTNILDLGTGTGIWAIDFAAQYDRASVTGTDLAQIQPHGTPPNCNFVVSNWEEEWPFPDNHFGYVHGRMLVVAMKDVRTRFKAAYKHLKPGGWFEIQDLQFPFDSEDGITNTAIYEWSERMLDGASRLGVDMGAPLKFDQWLREAGFEHIHHERFAWPLGPWSSDLHLKALGVPALTNFENGLEGFSTMVFTRGLRWSKAEVDSFLTKVREELRQFKGRHSIPIHVVWARKPIA